MKSVLKKIINYLNSMDPAKVMVIGFASVVLLGALLLNLPIATKSGESIGLLDALFTATSAVCVTGLIVVDTATYWSIFGQVVIITLICARYLPLVEFLLTSLEISRYISI